jgi:hypothetical protein
MSKLIKPSDAASQNRPRKGALSTAAKLTREQQKRLDAFRDFVRFKNEQWNSMTPEQQREAERKWELVKKTIDDDRAGYRQVFVDE